MSTAAPFPHQNTPDSSTTSGLSEPDGATTQAASTADQKSTDLQTTGAWDSFFLTGPPVSADFMGERASQHPPTPSSMSRHALSGEDHSLFQ